MKIQTTPVEAGTSTRATVQTKPAEPSPAGARALDAGNVGTAALVTAGLVRSGAGSPLLIEKTRTCREETLPHGTEPKSNSED